MKRLYKLMAHTKRGKQEVSKVEKQPNGFRVVYTEEKGCGLLFTEADADKIKNNVATELSVQIIAESVGCLYKMEKYVLDKVKLKENYNKRSQ